MRFGSDKGLKTTFPSSPGVLPQHADVLAGVGGGGRLQKQSLSVFAEPRAAEQDDITNE